MSIIDIIKGKEDFVFLNPVDEEKIILIEKELGVCISSEYRQCIKEFGIFSYFGHEFTGVSNSKRLNIVDITNKYRTEETKSMYVIEVLNIDEQIIWQNSTGEIFQSVGKLIPKKICDTFKDYVK